MSMSDILAALLFLLVPLRHSKADRRMAKDTFALIQDMVIIIIIIIIVVVTTIIIIQRYTLGVFSNTLKLGTVQKLPGSGGGLEN